MRLKRILIAGLILLAVLLVGPIGIIDKYEFYPNGYDFEYKSFNKRWYSIVLLVISIYFLASSWMSYPQSDLEELEQFLKVLQPLQD